MPFELAISPTTILAMWAGGIALAAAAVAYWRIVGAGFLWTAAGASLLIGVAAAGAGPWAVAAVTGLVGGILLANQHLAAAAALGLAGAFFLVHALVAVSSDELLVVTGAVALGGTTAEMLLGHWYLVDPQLPRWALRRLDAAGIGGLVADAVVVISIGALSGAGALGIAFAGLAVLGILMMLGVWFALREKGYEGVMAATGLSYLSVLTTLATVALGRFLIA